MNPTRAANAFSAHAAVGAASAEGVQSPPPYSTDPMGTLPSVHRGYHDYLRRLMVQAGMTPQALDSVTLTLPRSPERKPGFEHLDGVPRLEEKKPFWKSGWFACAGAALGVVVGWMGLTGRLFK